MIVHIVYMKVNGEFEGIKGVHLSKEEAMCDCVKCVRRLMEGGDWARLSAKLILSESGVETPEGDILAVIETRNVKEVLY